MANTIPEFPHDRALPHLPAALNTAAMQRVLQESLLGDAGLEGRFHVRACHIERIRYKPGRNCLLCYRLQLEDERTQAVGEQILSARVYTAGGSRSRFARAQREALVSPRFGRPLIHLPDLDMVAWAFPNDRKLKGLPRLTDPGYLQTVLLPPLIARYFDGDHRIAALTHKPVHYNPEHSCMVQIQLQLEHKQTGERQPYHLYGKTYYNDEGEETYRLMRLMEQHAHWCEPGNHLRVAQPLGYEPELKVLWQRGLPGQTLLALDMESSDFLVWLERGAAAVAAFHQAQLACSRSSSVSDWAARLKEMRVWLPAVRPGCQPLLEPLVDQLLSQATRLGEQPAATLHGDLHLQNFFLEGDGVALIDLDNVHSGSPWQDVGSFIGGLLYRGLHLRIADPILRAMIATFCRSYEQNVPWRAAPWTLKWFVAAALINERAFRCITRLKDGRLDVVDGLVALAAQISEEDGLFELG